MSKRYKTLPSISAEISTFVELCVINNPSSCDETMVFLNPGISAEISTFVELCVINNPSSCDETMVFLNPGISAEISASVELCVINNSSSPDESIVFLNPGSHWVKWLNSLAYKVCKFALLHALHILIPSLELFWASITTSYNNNPRHH